MSLVVSFGAGNLAAITAVRHLEWQAFAEWLTQEPPEVTDKASRGWYCPAEFNPVYRDSENFVARHAITYDFDHVNIDTWGEVLSAWDRTAFAIYTTFSHSIERPRFRVVMPLSRPAGYDEYQAVARIVATDVGIDLFAGESFVPAQLMFAPTRPLGGLFTARINEGAFLDVDAALSEYADWTDRSSWPRRKDGDSVGTGVAHIDHLAKPGIVGEFNRAFTVSQAIERFNLPYKRVR